MLGVSQVKPIIFNRAIEAIEAPSFREDALPFKLLTKDTAARLDTPELEDFLTSVYRDLASRDLPVAEKVHVLAYLYMLSSLDAVANIVINSSFAPLLLKVVCPPNRGTDFKPMSLGSLGAP